MRTLLIATLMLAATPAFAVDAVTYKGTLGTLDIIAELAAPSPGALVGRYSYMRKGGDIPLDLSDEAGGPIRMVEEAPCTPATCLRNDQGDVDDAPVGAYWSLSPSADGARLTGRWENADAPGKKLDIVLERIGQRTLPDTAEITPYGLHDSAFALTYAGPGAFTAATAPYEFAKMDVPLVDGEPQTLAGSQFDYVTDKRTGFGFPRLIALADGSAIEPTNRALARRHAEINMAAFDCLSQIYAGFGGDQYAQGTGPGTLGGYDSETVHVHYLSPTVMDWSESGSTFCGGAYPNNHADNYIIDVPTGMPLALANVFKDWIATNNINDYGAAVDQDTARAHPQDYSWSAGEPLIDYVRANRQSGDDGECDIDGLIETNLGLRFEAGDKVVFTLVDLPHALFACSDDLLTVPLADIPQLLTPTAQDYFPALSQ